MSVTITISVAISLLKLDLFIETCKDFSKLPYHNAVSSFDTVVSCLLFSILFSRLCTFYFVCLEMGSGGYQRFTTPVKDSGKLFHLSREMSTACKDLA